MPPTVVVAVIGAIAAVVVALLNNWDKLFPKRNDLPQQRRLPGPFRYRAAIMVGVATMVVLVVIVGLSRGVPDTSRSESEASSPTIVPTINSPLQGAAVGGTEQVSGISPFVLLDHYVLVTSVTTGVRYVVGDSFRADSTGAFSTAARFGSGNLGVDEQFSIQVVSTSNRLAEGPIAQLPADARVSRSVTVTRVH